MELGRGRDLGGGMGLRYSHDFNGRVDAVLSSIVDEAGRRKGQWSFRVSRSRFCWILCLLTVIWKYGETTSTLPMRWTTTKCQSSKTS